ncbi:MAG: SDR family oxidoreductase [bacterium]
MDLGLNKRVALVAASSQGLGKAIASSLAREGANVVICSRSAKNLQAAEEDIRATAAEVETLTVVADLTQPQDIEKLVEKTVERFGTVHILVNNAGGPPPGFFSELNDESWQMTVDLILMSSVRLTRAVLPFMKKQRWGRIINVTSVSVKQPIDELLLSNSLRLSVIGWAKTLSNQVAKDGILINNVCPGWTRTERVAELIQALAASQGKTPEEIDHSITSNIPIARMGKPEELANLVVFLASERASYLTGTSIQVDGGSVKSIY